jgi:hypothetical protein
MVIKGDQCSMASGHPRGVRIELHLARLKKMYIHKKEHLNTSASLATGSLLFIPLTVNYHIQDRIVMIMDRFCMNSLLDFGLV